jgi:hypothetical protein
MKSFKKYYQELNRLEFSTDKNEVGIFLSLIKYDQKNRDYLSGLESRMDAVKADLTFATQEERVSVINSLNERKDHFFKFWTDFKYCWKLYQNNELDSTTFELRILHYFNSIGFKKATITQRLLSDLSNAVMFKETTILSLIDWVENEYNKNELSLSGSGNDKQKGSSRQSDVESFKDLFIDNFEYEKAIDALKEVHPPIIDKNNVYRLGQRKKSVFSSYKVVLENRGWIKEVSSELFAKLIAKEFKTEITGKTIDNIGSTPYQEYHKQLGQKINN